MQKTMIIDEHPIIKNALKNILHDLGLETMDDCVSKKQVINNILHQKPDILIIDIDNQSVNGLELISRLREREFYGSILVFTTMDDDFHINRSIQSGADGFISKKEDINSITSAIKAVSLGYAYFPNCSKKQNPLRKPCSTKKIESLSNREVEVLKSILQGRKNIEIAMNTNLSQKTVSTYKHRIFEKFGVANVMELSKAVKLESSLSF
jgi:two-component system response regulator EvgA